MIHYLVQLNKATVRNQDMYLQKKYFIRVLLIA